MELKLEKKWTATFRPQEIALIIRALLGRMKPADTEEAKALADAITHARTAEAKQLANEMTVHSRAAEEI
jgi:hypothetical protein